MAKLIQSNLFSSCDLVIYLSILAVGVILSAMELSKKAGCASGVSCCWSKLLKMDLKLLYSCQVHKTDPLIFLHFYAAVILVAHFLISQTVAVKTLHKQDTIIWNGYGQKFYSLFSLTQAVLNFRILLHPKCGKRIQWWWGKRGGRLSEILKTVSVEGSTKFFRYKNIQKRYSSFQKTSNIPC